MNFQKPTNNLTMKKTNLFYRILPAIMLFMSVTFNLIGAAAGKQEYYEIKIYSINGPVQEAMMDAYLKDAYLPALHRAGISNVGVFKPIESDTAGFGKLVYVFIPFKTLAQYEQLPAKLAKDQVYAEAGKAFLDAPYNNPPFVRYESILSIAFTHMPQMKVPTFTTPPSERIYEYRSYESATEAKAAKKIQMFNEGGEIGIFQAIGANPVFYSKVISGGLMPRLLYLTTYADMKSHDERWAAFRTHPDWKRISGMEEYKNTTSKTKAFLLHPTSYSDF
jgi:hypothetical protein